MPLYEYECLKCGHRFERIQKFSDKPVTTCPQCKGKVKQLLSASAFHLKGSGWYATDYGGKSQGKSESASEQSEPAAKDSDKGDKEKKDKKDKGEKSDKSEKKEPKAAEKKKETPAKS